MRVAWIGLGVMGYPMAGHLAARGKLDVCVYKGSVPPKHRTPPRSSAPKALPGEEYETAKPLPPIENEVAPVEETTVPAANDAQPAPEAAPAENAVAPPEANAAEPQ